MSEKTPTCVRCGEPFRHGPGTFHVESNGEAFDACSHQCLDGHLHYGDGYSPDAAHKLGGRIYPLAQHAHLLAPSLVEADLYANGTLLTNDLAVSDAYRQKRTEKEASILAKGG